MKTKEGMSRQAMRTDSALEAPSVAIDGSELHHLIDASKQKDEACDMQKDHQPKPSLITSLHRFMTQ